MSQSKFKIGDSVVVIEEESPNYGQIGEVIEADRIRMHNKGFDYRVKFSNHNELFDDEHLRSITPLDYLL